MKASYERLLDYALGFPETIVTLAVGAFVLSLFLVPFLGTEFFPVGDHGQFFIRMRGPTGTRIELMAKRVEEVSQVDPRGIAG